MRRVLPSAGHARLIRSRSTIGSLIARLRADHHQPAAASQRGHVPAMCGPPTSSRITSAPPSSLHPRERLVGAATPRRPSPRLAAAARACARSRPPARPARARSAPRRCRRRRWRRSPAAGRRRPRPACITIASKAVRNDCGRRGRRGGRPARRAPRPARARWRRRASPGRRRRPGRRRGRRPRTRVTEAPSPPPARPPPGRECPVGQPGGTGCLPSRCSTSAGLTPANGGAITTSKRSGSGSGRSSTSTTSRPPTPRVDDAPQCRARRVAVEPPAGDVLAAHEGDAGLGLRVLEEQPQRRRAGGLAAPARVHRDRHHGAPLRALAQQLVQAHHHRVQEVAGAGEARGSSGTGSRCRSSSRAPPASVARRPSRSRARRRPSPRSGTGSRPARAGGRACSRSASRASSSRPGAAEHPLVGLDRAHDLLALLVARHPPRLHPAPAVAEQVVVVLVHPLGHAGFSSSATAAADTVTGTPAASKMRASRHTPARLPYS